MFSDAKLLIKKFESENPSSVVLITDDKSLVKDLKKISLLKGMDIEFEDDSISVMNSDPLTEEQKKELVSFAEKYKMDYDFF